ncbi:MAG: nucleotidyltransferase family protein [Geodermatophilaceae bacterium]
MAESVMSAHQAANLLRSLEGADIRCWVMGGWGVDALVGRETRDHHDLDLLVNVDDLPSLHAWLRCQGFRRLYEWDETRPVENGGQYWETAFVEGYEDGRELDVHAIHVAEDGTPTLATTDPWGLPHDVLMGAGVIAGRHVSCVSGAAQVMMHHGYELPPNHLDDLAKLDDEAH